MTRIKALSELTECHDSSISLVPLRAGNIFCDERQYMRHDVIFTASSEQHQRYTGSLTRIPFIIILSLILLKIAMNQFNYAAILSPSNKDFGATRELSLNIFTVLRGEP